MPLCQRKAYHSPQPLSKLARLVQLESFHHYSGCSMPAKHQQRPQVSREPRISIRTWVNRGAAAFSYAPLYIVFSRTTNKLP